MNHRCELLDAINSVNIDLDITYTLEELLGIIPDSLHEIIKVSFSAGKLYGMRQVRISENKTDEELKLVKERAHVALSAIRSNQTLTTRKFVVRYVEGANDENIEQLTRLVIQQTSGGCFVKDWLIDAIELGMKENRVKLDIDIRNG